MRSILRPIGHTFGWTNKVRNWGKTNLVYKSRVAVRRLVDIMKSVIQRSVCLFACLFGVFRPTGEFFTHLETSWLPVKGCSFWPILALIAIKQWGYLSVPHLLWHGASVYDGHLREPVKLTPISVFGSVADTICFNNFGMSRLGFEHPNLRLWGERFNRLRHRRGLERSVIIPQVQWN